MHMSFGLPLISAEHEPHLPALQFQRTARSLACVGLDLVDGVEHDHALDDVLLVLDELALALVAAPDLEGARVVLRRRVLRRLRGRERVLRLRRWAVGFVAITSSPR